MGWGWGHVLHSRPLIFVDIGAHRGQTLAEATRQRWGFQSLYAVEPMPTEFARLEMRFGRDPRVVLSNIALSDAPGTLTLYGDNALLESSMFPEKDDVDPSVRTEVRAMRATDYFEQMAAGHLFVKINAEGAEVPILKDLLASGAIACIDHLLVDFDVRKIPGWEPVADEVLKALRLAGVNVMDGFPYGVNHAARIAAWLAGEGL